MRTKKESKTYLNIFDKQNETKAYDKTTIAATAFAVRAGAPAKEAVTCEIRKQKRPLTVTNLPTGFKDKTRIDFQSSIKMRANYGPSLSNEAARWQQPRVRGTAWQGPLA